MASGSGLPTSSAMPADSTTALSTAFWHLASGHPLSSARGAQCIKTFASHALSRTSSPPPAARAPSS
eukprot:4770982-Pyramimonas_sp.AAC.1